MPGAPEGVTTAHLVGGPVNGVLMPTQPGQEVIEIGGDFLVLFGGDPELRDRLESTRCRYGFARVETGPEGPHAIFEFIESVPLIPQDPGDQTR